MSEYGIERRFRAAEIAEHLDVSENEFKGWLAGEQGDDWPKPAGEDDDGLYWTAYDFAAWAQWFEEG